MPSDEPLSEPSRRQFLLTGGSAVVAGVVASVTPADAAQAQTEAAGAATAAIEGAVPITLRINGRDRSIRIDPRTTLLDCLREALALTGTKKGCDHGQCGACTVHVDGRRVLSCLNFALMHDGHEVTTIEGLATPEAIARHAVGLPHPRCVSMRLLHVGSDHVRGRIVERAMWTRGRRGGRRSRCRRVGWLIPRYRGVSSQFCLRRITVRQSRCSA